jgi:hypothetical protein
MNSEIDFELEDRLRARLRELDGIALAPYATLRERAPRPSSSAWLYGLAGAAVVLIVIGAIVNNQLRGSHPITPASGAAGTDDCGAQTSQFDAVGHLVGVTKDSTTILVRPLADLRPEIESWFDWYMTSDPGDAALTVYAQQGDRPKVAPTLIAPTGANTALVRFVFPQPGCWRLHAERAGGTLSGDLWVQVLPTGTAASPNYASADCSATSRRDAAGLLIGTTQDSTEILVGAPAEIRASIETTFDWQMLSGEASPLTVYAQYGDGSRVAPLSIETLGLDHFRVRLAFPRAGCWRLHSDRIGGKLSGDVWVQVLPIR